MTQGEHSFSASACSVGPGAHRVRSSCPTRLGSFFVICFFPSCACLLVLLCPHVLLCFSSACHFCKNHARTLAGGRRGQRNAGARRAVWVGLHPVAQRHGACAEARCMQGHAQGNRAYKGMRKAMEQQGHQGTQIRNNNLCSSVHNLRSSVHNLCGSVHHSQMVHQGPQLGGRQRRPVAPRPAAPAQHALSGVPHHVGGSGLRQVQPQSAGNLRCGCGRLVGVAGIRQLRWLSTVAAQAGWGSQWRPRVPALRTPAPPLRMAHAWAGILPASLLGAPAGCCPR